MASKAGEEPGLTLASRAGSLWKLAPKITRNTFEADWLKYEYFLSEYFLSEAEAVRKLPFCLSDELFALYFPVFAREKFTSLREAKKILDGIAGTHGVSHDDFSSRIWRTGEETIAGYMFTLQTFGATLQIPEGLVKSHFLKGIPKAVADELRVLDWNAMTCGGLADSAERIFRVRGYAPEVQIQSINAIADMQQDLRKLYEEINALRMDGFSSKTCFKCHLKGHIARNCRSPSQNTYGNHNKLITCYSCGQKGHSRRQCPKN